MRYTEQKGSNFPYPQHDIDPSKKDAKWCMEYARAAWADWCYSYPKGVFSNNAGDYEKFKMYALAKQPNTQYKKWMGVDAQTDNTWMSNDWSIRSIVSLCRDKSISRLMEQELGIVATPIDMLAKSELDQYYSEIKAKLAVRQMLQQVNSDIAQHPIITLQPGEPLDIEELEMRVENGEQFNRSKDAELAIELGFYENDYTAFRRKIYEDLFDLGVAGYREWLGDDNKPKFRAVNPDNVVINYCRNATFSELVHAGELIDVSLIDLATVTDENGNLMFTEDELQEFASSVAGKWGNPLTIGHGSGWIKPYDKFKCKVLDIEFYTYNTYTYRNVKDKNGNKIFYQEQDNSRGNGSDKEKYMKKRYQFVYKCKWIVGTDKCYDYGMAYDQKRSNNPQDKSKTKLGFRFISYNFYEMRAQGMMERLIPHIDDYQLTIMRIQNWKNRAVPSGWWVNLDMLENVALNKGGKNMEPKELLQMFFDTGILVGRSMDAAGNPMPGNIQPVIPISNSIASELATFYQDLVSTVDTMQRIVGYNEITMGEANPKTLTPGYEMSNMSTNHALYPLRFAERWLTERLAEDVLCRMQQGVKKSGISGYARALNTNTLRFIQISPSIALRDYGIMTQEKTTDEQKLWILQQLNTDIAAGYLDTSDAILIINTHNAKQAMSILSYKVKKAKQAMNQQKMSEIQMQNQGAMQAAQIAQQSALQQKQMEIQAEIEKKRLEVFGELEKKRMETESQEKISLQSNLTKLQIQTDSGDAKENAATITAAAKIHSTHIAGDKALEKQIEANKKQSKE